MATDLWEGRIESEHPVSAKDPVETEDARNWANMMIRAEGAWDAVHALETSRAIVVVRQAGANALRVIVRTWH
jgi:hypothetical protein